VQADCLPDPSDVFLFLKVSIVTSQQLRSLRWDASGCAPARQQARASRPHAARPRCCAQDKGIGQDYALFYEAFATYLELKGSFGSADQVYQAGIDRCALATGAACAPVAAAWQEAAAAPRPARCSAAG
jgi:hypothetical protein